MIYVFVVQVIDTSDTSNTANSSDASKTSASVTRLSSYFLSNVTAVHFHGNKRRTTKVKDLKISYPHIDIST